MTDEGDSPGDLQAELETTKAALKEATDKLVEHETTLKAAKATTEALERIKASLHDDEDDDDDGKVAELPSKIASLVEENTKLTDRLTKLESESKQAKAEALVKEHLTGKVPTEAWADWTALFVENEEKAVKMAASLPKTLLGGDDAEALTLEEDAVADLDKVINAALDRETRPPKAVSAGGEA